MGRGAMPGRMGSVRPAVDGLVAGSAVEHQRPGSALREPDRAGRHRPEQCDDNRRAIEDEYGLHFFRPRMMVVIGRRGGISPLEFRRAESDVKELQLVTYDDLLDRARLKLRKVPRN